MEPGLKLSGLYVLSCRREANHTLPVESSILRFAHQWDHVREVNSVARPCQRLHGESHSTVRSLALVEGNHDRAAARGRGAFLKLLAALQRVARDGRPLVVASGAACDVDASRRRRGNADADAGLSHLRAG
jgi:hypothetical protein